MTARSYQLLTQQHELWQKSVTKVLGQARLNLAEMEKEGIRRDQQNRFASTKSASLYKMTVLEIALKTLKADSTGATASGLNGITPVVPPLLSSAPAPADIQVEPLQSPASIARRLEWRTVG